MAPIRPFVTSAVLTAIAVGYRNPANTLIADLVLPRTPVYAEKFKWTEYPISEGFRAPDNRVGRTSRVPRVDFSAFERDSSVEDFGLEAAIPQSDIDEAAKMRELGLGAVDPKADAVAGIADYNAIRREMRVAALVLNPAIYPTKNKLSLAGTDQFSNYDASDPIEIIKYALNSTLIYRPNRVAMGHAVWNKLSSHPKLIMAIKGGLTTGGMITKQQFADLFELKEVLVGEGYLDTARPGQAASLQRIWGRDMQFSYINPEAKPTRGSVTFGFTATYGRAIAGEYQDNDVGLQGGTVVRAGDRMRELIVAPDVGFLITNAVADEI